MKLKHHVLVSLTVSSIIYCVCTSFSAFISSLAGGILIDIDHLVDYYMHRGVDFRIKHFFQWCYGNQWKTLILFLHSIELIFILWLIIYIFDLGIFWIGFAIGISQHIVLDVLYNSGRLKLISYFFIFRFCKGFRKEYIVRSSI